MRSVQQLHGAVRRHLSVAFTKAGLVWAGSATAWVLLAGFGWAGEGGWRPGSAGPLVLDGLLALALSGGVIGWMRWRAQALSEARVARTMETSVGLPEGLVRGSLELRRGLPPGVSAALVGRGERTLLQRLDRPADVLAGPHGAALAAWLRRGGLLLALSVAAVLALGLIAPERALSAWGGLGDPIRVLAKPSLPVIVVRPGDVTLPRGRDLAVEIDAIGRDSVTLHWQPAGDIARALALRTIGGAATHELGAVSASTRYWVTARDGAASGVFTATPVDPLFVTDVTVRVEFPGYVGRAPEEYRGDTPSLELPMGSRISVEGRGSRGLGAAELRLEADERGGPIEPVVFDVADALFRGSWIPTRSGSYRWHLVDEAGSDAELAPQPIEITLVADRPPLVEVTLPGQDTVLPLSLRQPLVIQTADDYGVEWLELVAWRVTALGTPLEPVRQRLDVGGVQGAVARPLLDVTRWGLLPGDEVRYLARARDTSPLGQETVTREFVLRMPDAAELRREAQEELAAAVDELETLADRARAVAEEARDLERRANAPDRSGEGRPFQQSVGEERPVGFEEREDLRSALERQESMAAQVDSLRAELGELSDALQEAGASDSALREDLDELQDLLEDVAGPDLRERLRELAEQMDDMDREAASEALRALADEEEAFRDRLEEALERMKRAAVEQDFRATASEARDLAAQEEALAEALAEEPSPERAAQQDELSERAASMAERVETLGERLEELGESDAAAEVRQAQQETQGALESMREAADAARRQRGEEASQQAGEASRQMSSAAEQLQQAQQEMMRQRAEAYSRALAQTAQDALSLARRQAELRDAMAGASQEDRTGLRADVAAVEQGVRNMAEGLSMAARLAQASVGEREVGTAMGQAMGALEQTVAALDRTTGPGQAPTSAAERSVDALNQVALTAMAAARQLAEGGDPGSAADQMTRALEELAQQQADLNNQASQMMPLELSPQAMQSQMQQLSQGQQSVASELGELSNQEAEGAALGDLEALAREAEAVARELATGRLDSDTRRRQERLFHRLLDAGRSLEQDELSEERESAAPGAFDRGEVEALDRAALGLLGLRRPDAEALGRLSPAARALVLRYFQRLNQGGGG